MDQEQHALRMKNLHGLANHVRSICLKQQLLFDFMEF